MKYIEVKKVPKKAVEVKVSDGIQFIMQTDSYLYIYVPYVNCFGEHVFVRYAYNLKEEELCYLPLSEK